ncbi:MAG: cupin domain-containing protein [Thermomicrobiales bacterium]
MTNPTTLSKTFSRRNTLLTAGALAMGAALIRIPPGAAAQDATPTVAGGGEIEGAPGVWAEVFSSVQSVRAPEQTVYLARFTFFPGSEIFSHGHPGTTNLSVESGTFGWTLVAGTTYVVRGAKSGGADVEEITESGTEVILDPGDAIYYEDDVMHTARCVGDEAAIVNAVLILTTGEPLLMPMDEAMEH